MQRLLGTSGDLCRSSRQRPTGIVGLRTKSLVDLFGCVADEEIPLLGNLNTCSGVTSASGGDFLLEVVFSSG